MPESCPEPRQDCKYFGTTECFVNTHHFYYPGFQYATRLERFFRELPQNKERLQRCDHDLKHIQENPPEKPSHDFMVGFVLASDVHIPASVRKEIKRGKTTS